MKLQRAVSRELYTRDDMMTFDKATIDSAGVFLNSELERLDPTVNMPLVDYTWSRDIDLRTDVSIADEISSFTNTQLASPNGIAGSNKAWVGKDSNAIVNTQLDIGKTIQPLQLWALQIGWTLPELAAAQRLGRPIDSQKTEGLQLKHQMDIDEQVYVGDSALGMNGMLNHSALASVGNAVTGGWATATAVQILGDINEILVTTWKNSGYARMPTHLLIDPTSFALLASTPLTVAGVTGGISLLTYMLQNNIATQKGVQLKILPVKWLLGTNNGNPKGVAATNSMFAYTKSKQFVRFPLVGLQRTPIEYRDLRQLTTYYGRLGAVELVYPETASRRSNLG
jgi:hypothetical protein